MSRIGDYFLYFETNPGSGRKGCVAVLRRGRRHPNSHLTRVTSIAHTCEKPHHKSVSMALEYFEKEGTLIWVKP